MDESDSIKIARIETMLTEVLADRKDHEGRIRTLEKISWAIPPTVLSSIVAAVFALVHR